MAQNIENDGEVTVNRLLEFCKEQVKKGNGDKRILISDDDEGNGFQTVSSTVEPEDVVLLG